MEQIDKIIREALNQNIEKPQGYVNMLKETLNNIENCKKKHKISPMIYKFIAISCCCIIMTTTIVFAKEISNFIYNIFNPITTSEGVVNAARKGYFYNTDMDYIKSDNVKLKIDYVLMDDFNLNVVFNLNYEKDLKDINKFELSEFIITDENKNIICCNSKKIYEEYCKKNNIPYDENKMKNNYTNNGYGMEIIEKSENTIKFIYKMYSTGYPKSKELNIKFRDINLSNYSKTNSIEIKGNWEIKIQLPKEMYNRELINYNVSKDKVKQSNIIIESAIASIAEMQINLKIEKGNNQDILSVMQSLEQGNEIFDEIIIENQRAEKFKPINTREGSVSTIYKKNGDIEMEIIFGITKYDLTDTLKLKLIKEKNETVFILNR